MIYSNSRDFYKIVKHKEVMYNIISEEYVHKPFLMLIVLVVTYKSKKYLTLGAVIEKSEKKCSCLELRWVYREFKGFNVKHMKSWQFIPLMNSNHYNTSVSLSLSYLKDSLVADTDPG